MSRPRYMEVSSSFPCRSMKHHEPVQQGIITDTQMDVMKKAYNNSSGNYVDAVRRYVWQREEGYVPIGKVGLVCGQQVFNCKSGVIRYWRTVLHTADFFQDEVHINGTMAALVVSQVEPRYKVGSP